MNCANHPDVEKVAFCRTCGKALCANCTRDVRGVIYCENCIAARLEGVQPQQTVYQQVMDQGLGLKVPPSPGPGPSPGLAGVLAGFFPVGVGAVYCGQYAKGFAHLLIFSGLIWALTSGNGDLAPVLALGIGFFYIYQIVDAVRTAKALQMGQPAPDPFGLARTFSPGAAGPQGGERSEGTKFPTAAIILIGLGLLFMLHNLGFWFLGFGRLWPIILIGIGGWLFAQRWGLLGNPPMYDCDRCRAHSMMGPAVLVTLGLLFLLEEMDRMSFGRTWPLLLVVIGLVKVYQRNASDAGHVDATLAPPSAPPVPGNPQAPSTEVKHV